MVYYLLDGEAAKTRLDALRAGSARTTHRNGGRVLVFGVNLIAQGIAAAGLKPTPARRARSSTSGDVGPEREPYGSSYEPPPEHPCDPD